MEEEEEQHEAGPFKIKEKGEQDDKRKDTVVSVVRGDHNAEINCTSNVEGNVPKAPGIEESPRREADQKNVLGTANGVNASQKQSVKDSRGWQAIPKPKGHSALDYARWDRVEDDSSEEEEDDDDDDSSLPQYRFRVRTVGVRPVK